MPDNDVFEFQDSEVSSAELQDQKFVVRFSAAHVRRSINQDGNVVDGFLHAVELTILQASVIQNDSSCIGRISHGALRIEGRNVDLIPLPYEAKANVELELMFSNGSMCKVAGQGATLKPTGEARFVEWLKC